MLCLILTLIKEKRFSFIKRPTAFLLIRRKAVLFFSSYQTVFLINDKRLSFIKVKEELKISLKLWISLSYIFSSAFNVINNGASGPSFLMI